MAAEHAVACWGMPSVPIVLDGQLQYYECACGATRVPEGSPPLRLGDYVRGPMGIVGRVDAFERPGGTGVMVAGTGPYAQEGLARLVPDAPRVFVKTFQGKAPHYDGTTLVTIFFMLPAFVLGKAVAEDPGEALGHAQQIAAMYLAKVAERDPALEPLYQDIAREVGALML